MKRRGGKEMKGRNRYFFSLIPIGLLLIIGLIGSAFAVPPTPLPEYIGSSVTFLDYEDTEETYGPVEHSDWTIWNDIAKDPWNLVVPGDYIKWDLRPRGASLPPSKDGAYDIWLAWATNGYHWMEFALYAGETEADNLIWEGRVTCSRPHYADRWYRIYRGEKITGKEKVFKLVVTDHPSYSQVVHVGGILISTTPSINAPDNFSASRGVDGTVNLQWVEPQDLHSTVNITEYRIYRSEIADASPEQKVLIASVPGDTLNYTDESVQSFAAKKKQYYYSITAIPNDEEAGESPFSEEREVPALLSTVQGMVLAGGNEQGASVTLKYLAEPDIVLETTAGIDGVFSFHDVPYGTYQLEIRQRGYNRERIDDLKVDSESINIGSIQLTEDNDPPLAPGNIISEAGYGIIKLTWDIVEDNGEPVLSYIVYFSQEQFADKSVDSIIYEDAIATGGRVIWAHDFSSNIDPEKTYYYRVSALDLAGNESALSEITGPISALTLEAPSDCEPKAVTVLSEGCTLKWSEVDFPSGVSSTGYIIELARDQLFANPIRIDCSANEYTLYGKDYEEGAWYWRVRSFVESPLGSTVSRGVSVPSEIGQLFVEHLDDDLDSSFGVNFLGITPRYFSPTTPGMKANISFKTTEETQASIYIVNSRGQLIKIIAKDEELLPGEHHFWWDGTNEKQKLVKEGLYYVFLILNELGKPSTRTSSSLVVIY